METRAPSHDTIERHVSIEDVYEHVINGVRMGVLLALIREFAHGTESDDAGPAPLPVMS